MSESVINTLLIRTEFLVDISSHSNNCTGGGKELRTSTSIRGNVIARTVDLDSAKSHKNTHKRALPKTTN